MRNPEADTRPPSATHAIIAGANKAGTTSLFRYLADHPAVCGSSIKETNFFLDEPRGDVTDTLARYAAFFSGGAEADVWLEASPVYLHRGDQAAARIASALPAARLLFLLREPGARLMSYVRSNRQNLFKEEVARLDDEAYVSLVEEFARSGVEPPDPGPRRNAMLQYQRGCYADNLVPFLQRFGAERVQVLFFDDLRNDPRTMMRAAAEFLAIDPGFYDSYPFSVENRTREHRWPKLQKYVARLNMRLEPILNRNPRFKSALRGIYERVNEKRGAARSAPVTADVLDRLSQVYARPNARLEALMRAHYPAQPLPPWLMDASDRALRD